MQKESQAHELSCQNKYKVSIMVPVYNSEEYINRALECIIKQDLDSFEIIVVDDKSTDNSVILVKNFIERHPNFNIKLVENKCNQSVFMARIDGVLVAEGEYIGFMDADDYIDTRMYKTMYEAAIQNEADIVHCNVKRQRRYRTYVEEENVMTNQLLMELQHNKVTPMLKNVWDNSSYSWMYSKLIKRSLWLSIKELQLTKEPLYINMSEDLLTSLYLYYYSKKQILVDEFLYYYVFNKKSLVNLRRIGLKNTMASLKSYRLVTLKVKSFLQDKGLWQENKSAYKELLQKIEESSFVKKVKFKELKLLSQYFALYTETFNTYPNTLKIIKKLLRENFILKILIVVLILCIIVLISIGW